VRIAVVSDFHGNLVGLDAVVADLERTRPDLVLQGGDLALTGPRPAEVVDRVRELGWPGVVGNTDELLWNPGARAVQEAAAPALRGWLGVMFERLGPWATERLGEERIAWLRTLPERYGAEGLALVHASPGNLWKAPMPDAPDEDFRAAYAALAEPAAAYGHIHRPHVRALDGLQVGNSGSAGMPWDADPRLSYLLVEDGVPSVRRLEYDVERAARDAVDAGFPLADWLGGVYRSGRFTQPAP
jgi:predicted phosphodiesterase